MRPACTALLPVGLLLVAAVGGRLNAATSSTLPPPPIREADAVAAYPGILQAATGITLGALPFQSAERTVLRSLAEHTGSAKMPVSVSWVDDYGRLRVPRRAVYDPARDLLFYQTRSTRPCVYDGVTRAGIEAALQSETDALIATAHTYSFPSLSALAERDKD